MKYIQINIQVLGTIRTLLTDEECGIVFKNLYEYITEQAPVPENGVVRSCALMLRKDADEQMQKMEQVLHARINGLNTSGVGFVVNTTTSDTKTYDKNDAKEVAKYWIEKLTPTFPKPRSLTTNRLKHVHARIVEHGKDACYEAIDKVADSLFLQGKADWGRKWKMPGFDWMWTPDNFTKILEGKYDNERHKNQDDNVEEIINADTEFNELPWQQ